MSLFIFSLPRFMQRILKLALFLICFILSNIAEGQDAIYSQFYMSPTLLNPAFAGNTEGAYVAINYRNQWPAIDNAYITYSVAYDQQWKKNSGIGLYVNTDDAGDGAIKSTKVSGIYAYKIRLRNDTYIKGAIEAGYGQTRLDWDKLIFFDSLDPQYGSESPGGVKILTAEIPRNNLTKGYVDIGSGFMLYNPLWYVGISYKHMNSPNIDFVADETGSEGQLPSRLTLHGGMQLSLERGNIAENSTFISPNMLISKQADFWQVTVGAFLNMKRFFGGLWYRQGGINGDAAIASMGVKSGIFKIGYSFDFTISELSIGSGGTHEIGISMLFDKLQPKKYRYSDCFNMFR